MAAQAASFTFNYAALTLIMLITLVGPTAVGKTRLSIRLAQRHGGAIIMGDPRQMYRGMDIGSAKPTPAEQAQAPHYLIDAYEPEQRLSAGDFERIMLDWLPALWERYPVLIVVGGATLYMDALWFGLDQMPPIPPELRDQVQTQYRSEGLAPLLTELARVDPVTYARVDRQNPARVMRAIEVYRASGQPISAFQRGRELRQFPFPHRAIALYDERPRLYQRIDQRVERMIEQGLENEVKALLARGLTPQSQALQSIGYQEWLPHFAGEYDRAEVIRLIQRNSRRYAKRQLTYWRRYEHLHWFRADQQEEALKEAYS